MKSWPPARWPPPTRQELLREVDATTDVDEAGLRLGAFHDHCRQANVRELTRLSRTVRRWQPQVLAWHTALTPNGPTKAVNLLVKMVKRFGHGLRNFVEYRLRLLFSAASMADPSHRIDASPSPTVDRVEPVLLGAGDPTGEVLPD